MPAVQKRPKLTFFEGSTIDDSIRVMRKAVEEGLVDPDTRVLASCVIAHCEERHDLCEINAVWDFVGANVKYVADPRHADTFATLRRTLELGMGDCDCYAIADATLLEAIGFKTYFRVVRTKGSSAWNHVYACVGIPKRDPSDKLPLDHTLHNARPNTQPPLQLIEDYRDFTVLP